MGLGKRTLLSQWNVDTWTLGDSNGIKKSIIQSSKDAYPMGRG